MATDTYIYNIYRIALYIVNIIGWTAVTVPAIYLTSHFIFCVNVLMEHWLNGFVGQISIIAHLMALPLMCQFYK